MRVRKGFNKALFVLGLSLVAGTQVKAGEQMGPKGSAWEDAFPDRIKDTWEAQYELASGLMQGSIGSIEYLFLDEIIRRSRPEPAHGRIFSRTERLERLELGVHRGILRLGQIPGIFLVVNGLTRVGVAMSGRAPGSLPSINLGASMVKRARRLEDPSATSASEVLRPAP